MKSILITNDDGYESRGLIKLKETLSNIAHVITIAPAREKSACSHSLSVSKSLRLVEIERDFYKLDDGTPTDCVYVGLREFFKDSKPDMVISGINVGSNMGEDTTYSGTVAGAMEGALSGIDSIAISQFIDNTDCSVDSKSVDFSLATDFISRFVENLLNGYLTNKNLADGILNDSLNKKYAIGHRKFLNINIPALKKDECKGVKITQLGYRIFNGSMCSYVTSRGDRFYYIGTNPLDYTERYNGGSVDFTPDFNFNGSEDSKKDSQKDCGSIIENLKDYCADFKELKDSGGNFECFKDYEAKPKCLKDSKNSKDYSKDSAFKCSQDSFKNSTRHSPGDTQINSPVDYLEDSKEDSTDLQNPKDICDFEAIHRGYISITPMHLDLTSYDDIKRLYKYLKDAIHSNLLSATKVR